MNAPENHSTQEDLFFLAIVDSYVDNPRFLRRDWLAAEVEERSRASEFLFGVSLEFISDLNRGQVADELRQEFESHQLYLPQDAEIVVQEKDKEWQVIGHNKEYALVKEDRSLNVYASDCRFVLLTAEPGAGKSTFMAQLADDHPNWPRYFIRRDQRTPLGDVGAHSFLLRIGYQLVALYPELFTQERVKLVVEQRIGTVAKRGEVVGAEVKRILASPFYQKVVQIKQHVERNQGKVTGLRIDELVLEPQLLPLLQLQNMALIDPALAMLDLHPETRIVILVDALDELRYHDAQENVLQWLTGCPKLPRNVRFVLTSRPHDDALRTFCEKQLPYLRRFTIETEDTRVQADLGDYVKGLVEKKEVTAVLKGTEQGVEGFEEQAVQKAGGNIGYLDALARGVDQAIASKREDALRELLTLSELPDHLEGLYAFFLRQIKTAVNKLRVEVEDLETSESYDKPIWPALYKPILGVLAVALAPLTPVQIGKLGGVRADFAYVTEAIDQLSQFLDLVDSRYRLYHTTVPEFLTDLRTRDQADTAAFYVDPARLHKQIVDHYRGKAATWEKVDWHQADDYGLRFLVAHLHTLQDSRKHRQELYDLAQRETFSEERLKRWRNPQPVLDDLQMVLNIALEFDDIVEALGCIGIYRDTIENQSAAQAVFQAIDAGHPKQALSRAKFYGATSDWPRVLRLYLAWEAAQQGDIAVVKEALAAAQRLPLVQARELCEALVAHVARTLARATGDTRNASDWFTELVPGGNPDWELEPYSVAEPPVTEERKNLQEMLSERLENLDRLVEEGHAAAISMAPFLDEELELVSSEAADLKQPLILLAATPAGQNGIDRSLNLVLTNPYPRYRDIALAALGVACLSVPEPSWVRTRLRRILYTALDREGVTFTFDLASVLLDEAQRRNLPAPELSEYLEQALFCDDRWGTAIRAYSARAIAMYWQGHEDEAGIELREASRLPSGFAGYASVTLLSLANRCHEINRPREAMPIWGMSQDTSLLDGAKDLAERVRDHDFRNDRITLVDACRSWFDEATPDLETALAALAGISDQDTRMAYVDHVSARWAYPADNPNWAGLKALVPLTLQDGTTLDAVLGRLIGPRVRQLSDDELDQAIRVCVASLTTGRPWKLGQWR